MIKANQNTVRVAVDSPFPSARHCPKHSLCLSVSFNSHRWDVISSIVQMQILRPKGYVTKMSIARV